jgi:predicted transcriptional regulator
VNSFLPAAADPGAQEIEGITLKMKVALMFADRKKNGERKNFVISDG